jgi:peptidoglycan/xylan/chitin deacetylase (PgdA/CDA1 family)
MSAGMIARKAAKGAVLPAGLVRRRRAGDLAILLYHRVGEGAGEIELSPAVFEFQMATVAASDRARSLDDALSNPTAGGLVVSIDDGFRDFYDTVLPTLVRHRVPAILYLATGFVEGEEFAPSRDALTWSQLRECIDSGVVTVGAHTHSHCDLSRLSETEVEREMKTSKSLIEDRLGVECKHFAYPWSYSSPVAERAARRLFESAALNWNTNRGGRLDPHELGRTPILRSDSPVFFRAKLEGALDAEALLYRVARRGPWKQSS